LKADKANREKKRTDKKKRQLFGKGRKSPAKKKKKSPIPDGGPTKRKNAVVVKGELGVRLGSQG